MEMDERLIRRQIRRSFHPVGWSLVIYYIILNIAVSLVVFVDMMIRMIRVLPTGGALSAADTEAAAGNGWGYILAGCIGLLILLCWKGKAFWKQEIWAKGKPMQVGAFFGILAVFLGCQLAASIGTSILEMILNQFGLSAMSAVESASVNVDTFSMWLYMAVWAPVTEELLFRGLVQRMMLPYGKKFAIFASAFLFGIFHGNLVQSPYAFLVGLVLGYVACEYSIAWAMLLHMINNMLLGDSFYRITQGLPEEAVNILSLLLVGGCAIAGIVVLVLNRRKIAADLGQRKMDKRVVKCFFSNPGVIVLTVLMVINMALMLFLY